LLPPFANTRDRGIADETRSEMLMKRKLLHVIRERFEVLTVPFAQIAALVDLGENGLPQTTMACRITANNVLPFMLQCS